MTVPLSAPGSMKVANRRFIEVHVGQERVAARIFTLDVGYRKGISPIWDEPSIRRGNL